MMADHVSWQKTSRRKQHTYINELSEKLKSGDLSQPEQVAITEECETAREDLKQFLEGSFKLEEDNWLPKYTKLQDLVNQEMTCQLIKQEEKLCHCRCCLGRCNDCYKFPRRAGEQYNEEPQDLITIPILTSRCGRD